jgi:hypothetical protein
MFSTNQSTRLPSWQVMVLSHDFISATKTNEPDDCFILSNIKKEESLRKFVFPLFVVTPNIGHWIPEDIEVKIDQAIDHIRQRQAFRSQQGGKQR